MAEDVKKVCKAILEKAFARVDVSIGTGNYVDALSYEMAVREFSNALGVSDSEMRYIQMNVSTCSKECLERIAYQPVLERL